MTDRADRVEPRAASPTTTESARSPERVGIERAGLRRHLVALQRIADENGGTRATGTPGYEESTRDVTSALREAGYEPTLHRFTTSLYRELAPPRLLPLPPARNALVAGDEIVTMQYSGSGDVTGPVVPVGLRLAPGPPDSTSSGCDADDFAGFPDGAVALLQRGGCFLAQRR